MLPLINFMFIKLYFLLGSALSDLLAAQSSKCTHINIFINITTTTVYNNRVNQSQQHIIDFPLLPQPTHRPTPSYLSINFSLFHLNSYQYNKSQFTTYIITKIVGQHEGVCVCVCLDF